MFRGRLFGCGLLRLFCRFLCCIGVFGCFSRAQVITEFVTEFAEFGQFVLLAFEDCSVCRICGFEYGAGRSSGNCGKIIETNRHIHDGTSTIVYIVG